MRRRLMDILACPVCGNPFKISINRLKKVATTKTKLPACQAYCSFIDQELVSFEKKGAAYSLCEDCYQEDIIDGMLECLEGHLYPIRKSIPRFNFSSNQEQRTKKTFDVEWTVFRYGKEIYGHTEDEELQDFFQRMVIDETFLINKTVLDAGCGIGRLVRSVGCFAKEVVGIDFSNGVEEAWVDNRENPFIHIVQGDIMNLPFKPHSFDYVYSKGVLQYVINVPRSIYCLALVTKPSGGLSITLYPKMPFFFEMVNNAVRKVTTRLPLRIVYLLSHVLIPFLSITWKWSGLIKRPINWNERAHMIFNWLSSEFQNGISGKEAMDLFRTNGFTKIRMSTIPIGITGFKKPL